MSRSSWSEAVRARQEVRLVNRLDFVTDELRHHADGPLSIVTQPQGLPFEFGENDAPAFLGRPVIDLVGG